MTKCLVTYAIMCHDMTICHGIKGIVLNFGCLEVYKSINFIISQLKLSIEFSNRNTSLFSTYRYGLAPMTNHVETF